MTMNVGSTDRMIRFGIAVVAALLALLVVKTGPLAIVLWVVAAIMAVTGVVRFCPIYAPFGMSTCKTPARR